MGTPFPEIVHALQADELLEELDVDVVHDHSMGGPLTARARGIPTVLTAHGPVTGELGEFYRLLSRLHPMVAISESQRAKGPHLPWAATVYNAIPVDEYPFETDKDDFVLFLGRISPEKGPDLAIEAARAAGRRIVVAAKCNEPAEHAYFEAKVRPLLGPDAEWYGHATTEEKKKLLAKASALVFPIQWDEPFGIVMVEAMACGTPVVALNAGSVPEVVVDGLTGYICDRPEELPAAIRRVDALDPDVDPVAGLEGAHPGRGAGEEHVAGEQGHDPGDEGQQLGHAVLQLGGAGLLAHVPVDQRVDGQVARVKVGLDPGAERAEGVEALGPRPLAVGPLQVARGDVVGAGEAEHGLDGVGRLEAADQLADDYGQLALEVDPAD